MKKIAVCKNSTFEPNFKNGKIYYYEYNNGIYSIVDDFSITFNFDKKWQTQIQDFFNFKPKNALFNDFFINLKESRKLKLEQLQKIKL
jgi:hypothetical protein